jgi:PAS domain S-box-containing protein
MNNTTMRRVLAYFGVIVAVIVAVAVTSLRNINRQVAGSDWVNHTHSVILETEALQSDLLIADGASHTFVVTADPRDRASSMNALSNVSEHLALIAALTRNEPAQKAEVAHITSLVEERSDFVRQVLESRRSGNTNAMRSLLAQDAGEPALNDIHRALEKLKNDELGLLTERDTASFLQAQTTRWMVWAGVILDFALLAGAGLLIRDDIAARQSAALSLQTLNNELEAKVKERTAELSSANDRLTSENFERRWANLGLEHQLRYSQLIVNSINDLVLLLTKASNITKINTAVTRTTGWEPYELVDKPFSGFARLTFEGPTPLLNPVAQAMEDGRELRGQNAVVEDKRGRRMPVRMTLFPLRDGDKVVGCVVILMVLGPGEPGSPGLSHQS